MTRLSCFFNFWLLTSKKYTGKLLVFAYGEFRMYRIRLYIVPEDSGNCQDVIKVENPTQTMNEIYQVRIFKYT